MTDTKSRYICGARMTSAMIGTMRAISEQGEIASPEGEGRWQGERGERLSFPAANALGVALTDNTVIGSLQRIGFLEELGRGYEPPYDETRVLTPAGYDWLERYEILRTLRRISAALAIIEARGAVQ